MTSSLDVAPPISTGEATGSPDASAGAERAGQRGGSAAKEGGLCERHLRRLSSCRRRVRVLLNHVQLFIQQSGGRPRFSVSLFCHRCPQLLSRRRTPQRVDDAAHDGIAGRPARAAAAERRSFAAPQPSARDRGRLMRSCNPAAPSCTSSSARICAMTHGKCHCLAAGLAATRVCGLQTYDGQRHRHRVGHRHRFWIRRTTASFIREEQQQNSRSMLSVLLSICRPTQHARYRIGERGVRLVHLVRVMAETRESTSVFNSSTLHAPSGRQA